MMKASERMKVCGARVLKVGITMVHSVMMLLVFWVLMDILQSQVRIPSRNLLGPVSTNPNIALHDYGYHAKLEREAKRDVVPVRTVKAQVCPVPTPMVLAAAMKQRSAPKITVRSEGDARGSANRWSRVDL